MINILDKVWYLDFVYILKLHIMHAVLLQFFCHVRDNDKTRHYKNKILKHLGYPYTLIQGMDTKNKFHILDGYSKVMLRVFSIFRD